MQEPKRKRGQPRKDNPKVRCTFRLAPDVIEVIRQQPNQAQFIENVVRGVKSTE